MVSLAIHGGAGGDGPWKGPTDLDPQRIACMHNVLATVGSMLENGLDALEAVTIAVEMMENEPLFNAGIGSVIAADGSVTMDASIMRGVIVLLVRLLTLEISAIPFEQQKLSLTIIGL